MKLKKKQNPNLRAIVITVKVNAEEMREILARANAWSEGNVSSWVRHSATTHKPKKEDLEK